MALFKVYMHLKYLIMSWNDLCMFISKAFKWNNNLFEYFWIIIQTVLASFDVIGFIILAPKTLHLSLLLRRTSYFEKDWFW